MIQQLIYFRSKGLTNFDQIEKYIESQKLKIRSQGNHYEKNYAVGRGAAGQQRLQQMEDNMALVRNKDLVAGATSLRKKGA